MKIALLGYASQGRSAYEYWNINGNELTVCDKSGSLDVPAGVKVKLGDDYLENLDKFDLLIRTPALHPRDILAANSDSPDILSKVSSVTNEFMNVCPTRNIIGVTGTKGKGTTSTLVANILEAAGKTVHLGGNIGIPPLDLLKNNIRPDDWVVLELANFQLIDLKKSPHIAVCLMVEPEHLNWHSDFDEYLAAKQQLFINQEPEDIAIYYAGNENSISVADASMGQQIPYMESPGAYVDESPAVPMIMIDGKQICSVDEILLLGKHNWQNVCAAVTAIWQISQDVGAIRSTILGFQGLPHRLEKVRELDGITYYNDSFSAAPSATIAALQAIEGIKILITGGVDKNLDLSELAKSISSHSEELQRVIIIGEVADKLKTTLLKHNFDNFDVLSAVNMTQIVAHAKALASPGQKIVLSPGTSSFDMFKNFEDRGEQFKTAVKEL